jgi:hypothetical protein
VRGPWGTAIDGTYHYAAALTIPRGKRLVIEYVSARIVYSVTPGALIVTDVAITTTVQNVTAKHSLFDTRPDNSGQYGPGMQFAFGKLVKLYGDGGSQIVASVDLFNNGDLPQAGTIEWVISGYFIG